MGFLKEAIDIDISNLLSLNVTAIRCYQMVNSWGKFCLVPVGWRHMYEMDMEHFANQNLSVVGCV